nr:hypothetical protein [Tanacetum cinerariifolium]
MSDYIPFEIQSEIMKRLLVKSLLQFRSVSKQWKSFIDNLKFIKDYHPNPPHRLLVRHTLNTVPTYTSIIDDNTFPEQKFPLTTPEPLKLLRFTFTLGFVDGLLGFYGFYQDVDLETYMVVLWNTSVRKCVGIPIPNVLYSPQGYTRIAFGVCRNTSDPKLVKINVVKVNESIGLLEYYNEGEMCVCGVWIRKDGVNKPFTKIYTVKVEGKRVFYRVLGFRNNGEAVIKMVGDYYKKSQIKVYEPSSGRTNGVGISGDRHTFTTWSYMETLLLLDESNSIIH